MPRNDEDVRSDGNDEKVDGEALPYAACETICAAADAPVFAGCSQEKRLEQQRCRPCQPVTVALDLREHVVSLHPVTGEFLEGMAHLHSVGSLAQAAHLQEMGRSPRQPGEANQPREEMARASPLLLVASSNHPLQ